MTYEEAYMKCKTYEEFEIMVSADTLYALAINVDRMPRIEKAVNNVIKAKGWEDKVAKRNEKH